MTSKRLFFILILVIVLLCGGLIGGAYLANSALQKYSDDIVKKRAQVTTYEQEQDSLAKAKKELEKYRSLSKVAQSIVPQDKDQAQTVREIVNIASARGIKLGTISFPSSTLGESSLPGASPSSSKSKASLSQLTPVKDIPGVYDLQIVVTSDSSAPVSYNKFIDFLNALEHNRRTALVSSITITPDKVNRGNLTFSLTLDEYIKP
jgi:hypothetical protein